MINDMVRSYRLLELQGSIPLISWALILSHLDVRLLQQEQSYDTEQLK